MVLLDLFTRLRGEWSLDIAVVHVNHQLRGEESMGDEEFVRNAANNLSLPFYSTRVDTLGLKHRMSVSKQVAAREARYQFFEETRQKTFSGHVATGHQADDNAETVLFNALRGTGVRGLAGIPIARNSGHYIRPLLFARRRTIQRYAVENGIQFRNDSSNDSNAYTRNYLRHSVLPFLTSLLGPDPVNTLNRISNTMKRFGSALDPLVESCLPDSVQWGPDRGDISLPSFLARPRFLQEEILLRVLRQLDIEPTSAKIDKVIDLCSSQSGHHLALSSNVVVQRNRDYLNFFPVPQSKQYALKVAIGNSYSLDRFSFSLGHSAAVPRTYARDGQTEYIDGDKIEQPLTLRNWKRGDWFVPLGMKGRKKLSDYFGDAKISPVEKINAPVLESNGNIVWVCGRRLDDRYKITDSTTNAVKITYTPTTNPVN